MNNLEDEIQKLIIDNNVKNPPEKKEISQKEIIKIDIKTRCSRCGGDHFDLSCIYKKN